MAQINKMLENINKLLRDTEEKIKKFQCITNKSSRQRTELKR